MLWATNNKIKRVDTDINIFEYREKLSLEKLALKNFTLSLSEVNIINNNEMEIVEIVKVLRNDKNPWRIVADELNKMGYTNRRGNNWSTNLCSITFKGRY